MAHSKVDPGKRGYIANVTTIPPLVYPFQYNPAQISDSKRIDWAARTDLQATGTRGGRAVVGQAAADLTSFRTGFLTGVGETFSTTLPVLGRFLSSAELKKLEREQPRNVNFKFVIDGRETRGAEPTRRRNEGGDIIGDLAVIRSFSYPAIANVLDMAGARGTGAAAPPAASATNPVADRPEPGNWSSLWFNQPPTMTLIMGDLSFQGFVSDLKVTETAFNHELNPTRAEVEVTLIEKIDSITFIWDSLKRIGQTFYFTAYEDYFNAVF